MVFLLFYCCCFHVCVKLEGFLLCCVGGCTRVVCRLYVFFFLKHGQACTSVFGQGPYLHEQGMQAPRAVEGGQERSRSERAVRAKGAKEPFEESQVPPSVPSGRRRKRVWARRLLAFFRVKDACARGGGGGAVAFGLCVGRRPWGKAC